MNESCKTLINYGFTIRCILTLAFILWLYSFSTNKFIKKYIYLFLPIGLSILDKIDEIFISYAMLLQYLNINNTNNIYFKCSANFYYQYYDKIYDSLSYILTFLLCLYFKKDLILLWFIIYRIIGVILFCLTKDSLWLIVFFDFIKEYLLYLFVFNTNYAYILVFIFLKICFEIWLHKYHIQTNYKLDKE